MEKRPLGKTGVSLSVLGYGAAPLGGEFGPIDEAEGISAVKLALTKGVNYFDTSPFYGRTKSEIVLGRALQGVPRESYFLSTKVGRYDLAQFDFSAQRVSVSIDESLQRLGIGYIDLVICHDIEFANLDQIVTETLPALVRLREETKKFKFIGISGLPLAVFKYVLDRTDAVDVILTYCHNTLLDNSVSSMMDYFISKGVGVINASPTGMGLLTRAGPPAWHPAPPEIKSVSKKVAELCDSRGVDVTAIALRYSVQTDKRICTTLCGMSKLSEVESNSKSVADDTLDNGPLFLDIFDIIDPIHDVTWVSGKVENN